MIPRDQQFKFECKFYTLTGLRAYSLPSNSIFIRGMLLKSVTEQDTVCR